MKRREDLKTSPIIFTDDPARASEGYFNLVQNLEEKSTVKILRSSSAAPDHTPPSHRSHALQES